MLSSSQADQPVQVAHQPVPLMCLELESKLMADLLPKKDKGSAKSEIVEVETINARMDAHGECYVVGMILVPGSEPSGPIFFDQRIPRTSFGIDNVSVKVTSTFESCLSGATADGSGELFPGSSVSIKAKARVWCWASDKVSASNALQSCVQEKLSQMRDHFDRLASSVERLDTTEKFCVDKERFPPVNSVLNKLRI